MTNPVFFTENQAGVNPHDQLSDLESAQIIINHVYEGLKMAEKVGLPGIIKDFITTHHGMGITKFSMSTIAMPILQRWLINPCSSIRVLTLSPVNRRY